MTRKQEIARARAMMAGDGGEEVEHGGISFKSSARLKLVGTPLIVEVDDRANWPRTWRLTGKLAKVLGVG